MRLLSLIAVMILTACNPVIAGEYQEKPVMCGPEEEIFSTSHIALLKFLAGEDVVISTR